MITFSNKQLQDYKLFEAVRKGGRYNMFSREAITATGLSKDEYTFVMQHYNELQIESQRRELLSK